MRQDGHNVSSKQNVLAGSVKQCWRSTLATVVLVSGAGVVSNWGCCGVVAGGLADDVTVTEAGVGEGVEAEPKGAAIGVGVGEVGVVAM